MKPTSTGFHETFANSRNGLPIFLSKIYNCFCKNSQENSGDGELHIVKDSISSAFLKMFRVLSLVVSDLRSETKVPGSSLAAIYVRG